MEASKPAIDINFLRPTVAPDIKRIDEIIKDSAGNLVGTWIAYICHSPADLVNRLNICNSDMNKVNFHINHIWPISYLAEIRVQVDKRDSGFGTDGIADFIRVSKLHECKYALVRIGWSDESPQEKNLHFYEKNGWKLLFELGADEKRTDEYLAVLRIK